MKNFFRMFSYKTTWVGILGAATWLLKQPHLDIATVLSAVTAAGASGALRDAAQTLMGKNVS